MDIRKPNIRKSIMNNYRDWVNKHGPKVDVLLNEGVIFQGEDPSFELSHKEHLSNEQIENGDKNAKKNIDKSIESSCTSAIRYLTETGNKKRILVDNCVLSQGSTLYKTYWYKQRTEWAGSVNILPIMSPTPKYFPPEEKYLESVTVLPGIIHLYLTNFLNLYTSDGLMAEIFSHPGKYQRGVGWFDFNLFKNINLKFLDGELLCEVYPMLFLWDKVSNQTKFNLNFFRNYHGREVCGVIKSGMTTDEIFKFIFGIDMGHSIDRFRASLNKKRKEIPEYAKIVDALGAKKNQDAWHIYTAEKQDMDFFLTTDFKLIKQVNDLRNSALSSLKVKVVFPAQLAKEIGLKGIKESEIRLLRHSTLLESKNPKQQDKDSLFGLLSSIFPGLAGLDDIGIA